MNNQKTIFFTFFLLINVIHLFGQYAQENIPGKIKDSIHTSPNYPPKLIDGEKESQLIATRLKHPLYAIQNGIYGIVEVFLTVDTSGNIINSEIKKGLGFGCDEEAQRVLQFTSGRWTSAKHWGKKVYAKFSVPIRFTAKNDQLTDKAKGKFKTAVKEFDRKHYEGALSFFNSALRESPNYIDAKYYQGECYFALNRSQDACNSWNKSYELGKTGSLENSKAQFCNNPLDSNYIIVMDTGARKLVAIDSTLYTKDFVFKDGIYATFQEFQFNSPTVLYDSVTNKIDTNKYIDFDTWHSKVVKQNLLNKNKIDFTYYKDDGIRVRVKRKNIWGYCKDGYITIYDEGTINTIAKITLYFKGETSGPKLTSVGVNINIGDISSLASSGINPAIGISGNTKEKARMLDFETGETYVYDIYNFKKIIKRDKELYDEFRALKNDTVRKQMMYMFLKRFNKRNPIYIKSETYN